MKLPKDKTVYSQYVPWLFACYVLFIFRVTAQLIQKFYNLPFLPEFDAWHSGALTYPSLLASQILIIGIMTWVIAGFVSGRVLVRYTLGVWLLMLGGIYFLVMVFRLMAGFTFATDHSWLGAPIPAFFHIVLALFILLIGHFHYKHGRE